MLSSSGKRVNDVTQVAQLSLLLEQRLIERGVIDKKLVVPELSSDLRERTDELIDNAAELEGLLRIGAAIRNGETFSEPVAAAARVMIEEICKAIIDWDELAARTPLH